MKKNNLKNKTTERLQSDLKGLKIVTGALAGILIVLFAMTLYNSITKKEFDPLMIVAISLSAILPLQFSNMKKIGTELKTRKENN